MSQAARPDSDPRAGASQPVASGQPAAFFGWRIIVLGVIANALGSGLIGAYGFMVSPIIEEFGATPGQLGLGMSITIFSMAALAPVLGPIFDRGRLRAVMLTGVALMFTGMVLLSRGTALWQLALCLSLTAAGMSMYSFLPVQVMVVNWFIRRRGAALAISAAGMSLAGFAVPPLTAWLIELFTWRGALVCLAGGAVVIATPVIVLFAVRRPEDVGQHPDGDAELAVPPDREEVPVEVSFSSFSDDRNFWLIGFGTALALCVPVSAGVFLVRHFEELGISRGQSALVISTMAAASLTGKLVVGYLADRFDRRVLAVVTIVLHVLGLCIVATGSTLDTMFVAAIPLGLGGGGFIPLPAILQGACFGRLVIGRVSGMHAFLGLPFLLSAAPLVGLAASSTGSFELPFLGLAALQMVAVGVFAFVRVPPVEPGFGTA